jgi:hypothetical protein
VGEGEGHRVEKSLMGGVVGVLLDARGRPFNLPEDENVRREKLVEWFKAIDLYPEDKLEELIR